MKIDFPLSAIIFLFFTIPTSFETLAVNDSQMQVVKNLTREILVHGQAYFNLKELVGIGPRLSGSENAAKAVDWGRKKMESYGFDRVRLQAVSVPKWKRGPTEQATAITKKFSKTLHITALGNSVGTPHSGLEAEVIEVQSLEEVNKLANKVKGKIVFFNRAMDPAQVYAFDAYEGACDQREDGASQAAKYGAIAVLVRSLTFALDDHPHTGLVSYKKDLPSIPAAALSTNDAQMLSELIKENSSVRIRLKLSAQQLGVTNSSNVIGEIIGSELPEQIVLVGGHLDSWDLGQGAHDDGAGVVQSIEVLRAIKTLNLHLRRTLRVVLFMSEEFGAFGALEYAKQAKVNHEKHIAAIESDHGGFTPRGFILNGSDAVNDLLHSWSQYFAPIYADSVRRGEAETDVEPLGEFGIPLFSLNVDSQRYFDYHHAVGDGLSAVNARELHLGAAAMAILSYLITTQGI